MAAAIADRDADFIADLARRQAEAGADYVDCNSGRTGDAEAEDMAWLVETVKAATDRPVSLDSASPRAIAAGLDAWGEGSAPLINSVMLADEQLAAMLPMVAQSGGSVIALAHDDTDADAEPERRLEIARALVERITAAGISAERIFIDPVMSPVATSAEAPGRTRRAIELIREALPECHIVCGLSNVSFGLPARALLNRTFLAQAVAAGLDAAILDPLDREIMRTIYAAEVLAGRDEWCLRYIEAHREGMLD